MTVRLYGTVIINGPALPSSGATPARNCTDDGQSNAHTVAAVGGISPAARPVCVDQECEVDYDRATRQARRSESAKARMNVNERQ
jgi:hypothetical protein